MQELESFLQQNLRGGRFNKAVVADPRDKCELVRATFRPVQLKAGTMIQMTSEFKTRSLHKNFSSEQAVSEAVQLLRGPFREFHLFSQEADYHWTKASNETWKCKKKQPTALSVFTGHNREKTYLTDPHAPFWKLLGVTTAEGKIKEKMFFKYRQVEKFLEIVEDVLKQLPETPVLKIADFGCGKSYLSFALAEYLKSTNRNFEIIGIDLKDELIQKLNQYAQELCIEGLQFHSGDIRTFPLGQAPDIVISLHACDTATDYLLAKAVHAGAKAILSVPCCQHEFARQVSQPLLHPLLKHGILKERFASLATDAVRASILELAGYTAQVMEFVDTEHTPKNLLIRAIKRSSQHKSGTSKVELVHLMEFLHMKPKLWSLLGYGDFPSTD